MIVAAYATRWLPGAALRPGQLALADGTAVTLPDVLAEAQARGIPAAQLTQPVTRALVDEVINRRLLVAAAHKTGTDGNALVAAAAARARDMVVARALVAQMTGTRPVAAGDARRFMATHPAQFAAREIVTLDSVVASVPAAIMPRLRQANTMADVVDALGGPSVSLSRTARRLDTAAMPPAAAQRLAAGRPGELFMVPIGDRWLVGAISQRLAAPAPQPDQLAAARAGVEQDRASGQLQATLTQLRAAARIRYADPTTPPS